MALKVNPRDDKALRHYFARKQKRGEMAMKQIDCTKKK